MQEKGTSQRIHALIALVSLVSICGQISAAPAAPEVRLGRYRTAVARPTARQVALMSAPVTVEFPQTVQTVSQAIDFILAGSGFQLAKDDAGSAARSVLADLALPDVHRSLGPVTLSQALALLAGPGYQLVTDPVHRLITFELSPLGRAMSKPAAVRATGSVLPTVDIADDVDEPAE